MRIGCVMPCFGHFDYTVAAVCSFIEHTPLGHCLVVDDGTPGWFAQGAEAPLVKFAERHQKEVGVMHFSDNAGLTRCWNAGLKFYGRETVDFVVCANNDILFTTGWFEPLVAALQGSWDLVGPISNAPGVSARGFQDVGRYYPAYRLTDDTAYLAVLANNLAQRYAGQVVPSPINGFFMMAKAAVWHDNAFDARDVFDPQYRMTLNEDRLQKRWRERGLHIGVVPASFIFHYRSVTRGSKHNHGKWFRKSEK